MAIRRKLAGAAVIGAIGVAAALGTTGPADAAGRNISSGGVPANCNNSPYTLCLHWDSNLGGAMWGTGSNTRDLAGIRFPNNGNGGGSPVKNNAASMSCDTQELWCYSFFNENFTGNYDYLQPQRSGNLFYTWNDEASVELV
jgi:hypothetical protein